ncbi:aspartyl protease family protein 2 [Selaginella moellendorffii]|nr:aspartyl protease family protein 2 [Selaginella moellendorffii]|eukprot:XP_002981549.2 aspartyl protease family protein 2 [Selaginella moellendorffii]
MKMANKFPVALCCMLLCSLAAAATPGSRPLVGELIGTKLSLRIGTPPKTQLLQLDLDARVSSINCGASPRSSYQVSLNATDGSNPTGPVTIPGVPFKCGPPVAALGRGSQALPARLSPRNKKIVTYCLSQQGSSPIFFGAQDINFMPNKRPISPLLQYTPLVSPPARHSYAIRVNSVRVNGQRLPAVKPAAWALSSTEPYTRLVTPAYVAIRDAFRNLTVPRVAPVAPFDTCFNASGLGSTRVGPPVPPVELQLEGNATWTLFGANTMVFLKDSTVACLAFVDAGPSSPGLSVVGTFQQMHNLVRLDLEKQRFGFTGILFFYQTTCSNFNTTLAAQNSASGLIF